MIPSRTAEQSATFSTTQGFGSGFCMCITREDGFQERETVESCLIAGLEELVEVVAGDTGGFLHLGKIENVHPGSARRPELPLPFGRTRVACAVGVDVGEDAHRFPCKVRQGFLVDARA